MTTVTQTSQAHTVTQTSESHTIEVQDGAVAAGLAAHLADTVDAHDASAISFTPVGSVAATDVQAAIAEVASEGGGGGGGGAPTDADYLVGTANGSLSGEIVVGTSPGGELGGTWASPTVDATHSGSSHAGVQAAAEATASADATSKANAAQAAAIAASQPVDADLTTIAAANNGTVLAATTASFTTADESKLDGIEAAADVTDATNVNAAGAVMESDYDAQTVLAATLDNTPAALTVAEQTLVGRITGGNVAALSASQVRTLLDVPTTGEAVLDTLIAAKGDLVVGTANDTPAVLTAGTNGYVLVAQSGETAGLKWQAQSGLVVNTVAAAGATETLDGDDYNIHDITLDENVTFTFTTSAAVAQFTLILRQDGSGTNTVTWPASVKWHSATAPTILTTASAVHVLEFLTVDTGTTWRGFLASSAAA